MSIIQTGSRAVVCNVWSNEAREASAEARSASTKAPMDDTFGFRGAALDHLPEGKQHEVWGHAVGAISKAHNIPPEIAHNYLRSSQGRHFGDKVKDDTATFRVGSTREKDATPESLKQSVSRNVGGISKKHIQQVKQHTADGYYDR